MSTAPHHTVDVELLGPWSLATSRTFWEGFAPAALESRDDQGEPQRLRSVFRVDGDWSRAEVEVTQQGSTGRKTEYLHAVAEAALDGRLDGAALRSVDPHEAVRIVQEVKGLGPFSAELVVIRGANAPDAVPHHERRLEAEVTERYGPDHTLDEVSEAWRPFRTWAAVHLRTLREQRTNEINRGGPTR